MRDWRRWLSGLLLLAFAVALTTRRDELSRAVSEMADLSLGWLSLLLAATTAWIVVNGWMASEVTDGMGPTRGVMVQQVATAANNSVVGSGPVNVGLRIAMMRSWRIDEITVAVALGALNVAAAAKLWTVTLVVSLVGWSGATGDAIDPRLFVAGTIAASCVLTAIASAVWIALRQPRLLGRLARRLQPVLAAARRRWRRIPAVDLPSTAERFRGESVALVRRRGARIAGVIALEQVAFVSLSVLAVRAYGIDPGSVSTAQVLVAFGVVRLAAALTPVPGGIGIVELGTIALLQRFGAADGAAVAAVLTFRVLTFVLPVVVGGTCFVLWRRSCRGEPAPARSRDHAADYGSADGELEPGGRLGVGR